MGKKAIWFPAKRYGWGWGPPVCWQGWVVLLLWIAALVAGSVFISRVNFWFYFPFVAVMVGVLIGVCWMKGEAPKWRWGEEK